jgi:glycosyltransferase involved in cell wall biosynthesis
MKNIILSIVVPTRNRYDTLLPLLCSLRKWSSHEFEVIVSDNSTDNTEFKIFIEANSDPRIRYFYQRERLSAVENCDRALKNVEGEYVCFIGDDDGLSLRLLEFCGWMSRHCIDSAYFNASLYTWPETTHAMAINNIYNGKLLTRKYTGSVALIDAKAEYNMVIAAGGQDLFRVPRLYHGLVKTDCLKQLYSSVGTYFPGPVPDMSNAMALSGIVKRHCFVDSPMIISGHSRKSMSGRNLRRDHQGEIRKENSLPSDAAESWHAQVPFFWSGPTIWAQACLEACSRTGNTGNLNRFNFSRLYANCLVFCRYTYIPRVFKSIRAGRNFREQLLLAPRILYHVLTIASKRLRNFASKHIMGVPGIVCGDIADAMLRNELFVENVNLDFGPREMR